MLIYRLISFSFYLEVSAIVVVVTSIRTKDIEGQIDKDIKEIDWSITTKKKVYS